MRAQDLVADGEAQRRALLLHERRRGSASGEAGRQRLFVEILTDEDELGLAVLRSEVNNFEK